MEQVTQGQEPRYPLESVGNALRLLSMFVSEESIRVKDAASVLGVATGTAHRLLAMLLYHGYVSQDPASKVYVPGPMLLSVGLRASSRFDLRSQARPHLEQLNADLNETVHLAVLRGPGRALCRRHREHQGAPRHLAGGNDPPGALHVRRQGAARANSTGPFSWTCTRRKNCSK